MFPRIKPRDLFWAMIFCMGTLVGLFVPALADAARPTVAGEPTRVYVSIVIVDVDEVDSASQSFIANVYIECRWEDPRLAHGGTAEISRALEEVWHPRIQFVNQQKIWPTFPDIVEVAPDGKVVFRQRVWGTFSQPLRLRDFPFDHQAFTVHLAAVGYLPNEVDLLADQELPSDISSELSVADWEILEWRAESQPYVPFSKTDPTAGFAFEFKARRKVRYFVTNIILPLVLIVAMSWIVFWIDPKEFGAQIGVAVTTMLTLIAYRFYVGNLLPAISYLTRMDDFILTSTLLVFATLVEVVITSSLARRDKLMRARRIDVWSRWIFPLTFILVSVKALFF